MCPAHYWFMSIILKMVSGHVQSGSCGPYVATSTPVVGLSARMT